MISLLLLILFPQVVVDTSQAVPLPPVVVTATRSARPLTEVPVPTQLVSAAEIY